MRVPGNAAAGPCCCVAPRAEEETRARGGLLLFANIANEGIQSSGSPAQRAAPSARPVGHPRLGCLPEPLRARSNKLSVVSTSEGELSGGPPAAGVWLSGNNPPPSRHSSDAAAAQGWQRGQQTRPVHP